jgi:outer membrane beta-barrel protein
MQATPHGRSLPGTAGCARIACAAALLAVGSIPSPTLAQATPTPAPSSVSAPPANEQVVVPQVDRRDVRVPRFPSRDWEFGVFGGTFATQNFGSSAVGGLRLGYHITEDVFVEAALARTRVSDESFRQILPGGVFVNQTENLTYYNLSAGYNLLPGEAFVGRTIAKPTQVYVIGGVGSTRFVNQRRQTFNFGLGVRLYFNDRFSVRVDMRNHLFPLDLLGKRQNTQNLELTAGATVVF